MLTNWHNSFGAQLTRPIVWLNSQIGAHYKGDKATSIGVCCVGKGDALPVSAGLGPRSPSSAVASAKADGEGGYMNQAMWNGLLRLARQLMAAYHIPVSRVVGHRERPSGREHGKTCPGFDVAIIRNLLRQEA